ncbi:hypothetical protein BWQ96_10737 [Gracilariopsis chorda]|uniref:Uncharacterized protein n=1 Tax=Gracilariopsis chorda TaxID=448386 RepID=A0A2V3IBT5_9FLOR|nr:hypothetical protein BWQ96_10737 [Gracilariopsis chorda]|eukprot:PXF39565.1 hypothetical protein BWQ96_10737 [Gracilariopsis chorda]
MSSDKLLRMEPLEFYFLRKNCLMFYVGPKGPSIRGGFEMVRSYFYSRVLQFLEEMKRMALGVEVEMELFLAQSFRMSASVTGETTVRDFAVEQVNHFRKVPNPRNQESVIIRAVALFKGKLENWIPELRVEPDVQVASVSQPDAIAEPVTSVVNTGTSRLGTTGSVPESQGGPNHLHRPLVLPSVLRVEHLQLVLINCVLYVGALGGIPVVLRRRVRLVQGRDGGRREETYGGRKVERY